MPKDGAMPEHNFSTQEHYMFWWPHGCLGKPTTIVEKPTSIYSDKILFHFLYGYKSESEFVKKEEIIAVGDNEKGTVEVKGWSGKYRILNQQLFNKYIEEKVIELKN